MSVEKYLMAAKEVDNYVKANPEQAKQVAFCLFLLGLPAGLGAMMWSFKYHPKGSQENRAYHRLKSRFDSTFDRYAKGRKLTTADTKRAKELSMLLDSKAGK